ncbi:hypothetical protein AYI70_g10140 [Smittium culicis]|uniref:Uncharacterized protein n=1 Tax=Smittium culicis TaxID=133412 RepID=A0A1R1X815_9FUNG|nr:hypothetical protein AYI70_g10140 [Smittium culicis]
MADKTIYDLLMKQLLDEDDRACFPSAGPTSESQVHQECGFESRDYGASSEQRAQGEDAGIAAADGAGRFQAKASCQGQDYWRRQAGERLRDAWASFVQSMRPWGGGGGSARDPRNEQRRCVACGASGRQERWWADGRCGTSGDWG